MGLQHLRLRRAGALLVPLLAVILAQPGNPEARTWRVWKDGSGDFTSIQPAVDAAADGDTILIGPGRYTESSDYPYDGEEFRGETFVGIDKNDLTLMGVHRDSVVIGPMEQNFVGFLPKGIAMRLGAATGLTVRDLTVRNVRDGIRLFENASVYEVAIDSCGIGVFAYMTSLEVGSSEIRQSTEDGILAVGRGHSVIQDCIIADNPGAGIKVVDGASTEIRRCSFLRNNAAVGFQTGSSAVVDSCEFRDNLFGAVDVTSNSSVLVMNSQLRGGRNGLTIQLESTFDGVGLVLGPFDEEMIVSVGRATVNISDSDLRWAFTPAFRLGGYRTDLPTVLHDLRNNYWTTTDSQTIADAIYDGNDDPQINSFVLFEPFRSESTPVESESIGGMKARFLRSGHNR